MVEFSRGREGVVGDVDVVDGLGLGGDMRRDLEE